jgi:hypothetical protein
LAHENRSGEFVALFIGALVLFEAVVVAFGWLGPG